jgi:hypothetical protein
VAPRALIACVLCAGAAAGCGAEAADSPVGAARETRGVVVIEDDRSLPRGCGPAEVAALLSELFDAVNRGDGPAARALVVDPAMIERLERPAAGRSIRLRAVIVGYANGLGQIEFRAAPGRLIGKGAVQCEVRRFAAVGLGAEHSPIRMAPLCGRRPGHAVLACVRDWS